MSGTDNYDVEPEDQEWVDATSYPWPTGPYIPHEPEVPQDAFLWYQGLEALYGGAAGGGKLLRLCTPIPTPNGWTTMGELENGDELFDEYGGVIQVVQAHPVNPEPESYKLTFDDGAQIEACADHRWLTYTAKELAQLTRRTEDFRARRRANRGSRAITPVDPATVPEGYCKCGCGQKTNKEQITRIKRNPDRYPGAPYGVKVIVEGPQRDYLHGHAPASQLLRHIVTQRNQANPTPCLEQPEGRIRTTKEIAETLKTPSGRANHAISVAGSLKLDDVDLPMDPYFLGVWLGDGTTKGSTVTSADPEVIQAFMDAGWVVSHCARYTWRVHNFQKLLRKVGVLGNKHIPEKYLRASEEQRLALLQGLMDADGTCGKNGSVTFSNTNENLAEGVAELARSLGSKCSVNIRMPKIDGNRVSPRTGKKYKKCYIVKWSPDYQVFRLERKLERQNFTTRRTTKFHYIVGCEKIDPVPMRCITVSNPSGLFLAGKSMIPTHNSDALLMGALQYVDIPGYAAILLRKTYTELTLENALLDRSMKWLGHTDASWNGENRRWTFPSGATLTFGFLQKPQDRARYQSAEFQYVGFDELTTFEEGDYRFMFSRLRRVSPCGRCSQKNNEDPENHPKPESVWVEDVLRCSVCGNEAPLASTVPIRMRAATNPGGRGHKWVYDRFIKPWMEVQNGDQDPNPNRIFIPARLTDNPHIDQESYKQALYQLEPELAEQLLEGNWDVREPGYWMLRDPRWVDAAADLGLKMWRDHLNGRNPLPDPRVEHRGRVRTALANCIDWGEHTQGYVIWNLPHGGIFIPPSEVVMIERDPIESTKAMLEAAMRFDYPLQLTFYDAAGVQSMRTYTKICRRFPRFKYLWTRGIPFKNYKTDTIGYMRVLFRRTYEGQTERIIAIHPANKELIRQLKAWEKKSAETDEAVKVDDHGPDAIVAGIASTASEYRQYVEKELAEIMREEEEPYELGIESQGGVTYARS